MNNARHISEDDLALFALALMPPEEAALAAAHLKQCDVCREEVARLQGDLAAYALTAEMHAPSAAARTRLLDAVAKEKKTLPAQPAAAPEPVFAVRNRDVFTPRRRAEEEPSPRRMGAVGWFGWALAAGLAGLSLWQFQQAQGLRGQLQSQTAAVQQGPQLPAQPAQPSAEAIRAQQVLQTLTDPAAMQVALHLPLTPGATPKPEGHAAYVATTGNLVFVATHLRPIQPGKTYELWLLPAQGKNPIPAGTFRPDPNGNASVLLPTLPKNIAAKGFGVTIERDGGSETPTPPIVLAGTQS